MSHIQLKQIMTRTVYVQIRPLYATMKERTFCSTRAFSVEDYRTCLRHLEPTQVRLLTCAWRPPTYASIV